MLRKEIQDTLKSTRSKFVMALFAGIVFYDFLTKLWGNYNDFWLHPEAYGGVMPANMLSHPALMGFLSGGQTGHLPQIVIVWLLPIWCLLLCGDSYISEYRNGYLPMLYSRIDRKKIFICKIAGAFLSAAGIFGGILLLNFGMCILAFGKGIAFHGIERYAHEVSLWMEFSVKHPILVYLIYVLLFAVLCGLLCSVCVCISFYFPNYPILYSICFMIWYPQILGKYSMAIVVQPFSMAKTENLLTGIGIFCVLAFFVLILGYVRKAKYETL